MQVYEESLNKGEDQVIDREENLNSSNRFILNPHDTQQRLRGFYTGYNYAAAGDRRLQWPVKEGARWLAQNIYNLYYTLYRGSERINRLGSHELCIDVIKIEDYSDSSTLRPHLKALLKANVILSSAYIKGQLIVTLNGDILAYGGNISQWDDECATSGFPDEVTDLTKDCYNA